MTSSRDYSPKVFFRSVIKSSVKSLRLRTQGFGAEDTHNF